MGRAERLSGAPDAWLSLPLPHFSRCLFPAGPLLDAHANHGSSLQADYLRVSPWLHSDGTVDRACLGSFVLPDIVGTDRKWTGPQSQA